MVYMVLLFRLFHMPFLGCQGKSVHYYNIKNVHLIYLHTLHVYI